MGSPRIEKAAAIGVICGVLAMQLYVVLPGTDGRWYWPFLDYPMYKTAHYAGESFGIYDLRAIGCDGTKHSVSASELAIPIFTFLDDVEVAAGGRPEQPRPPSEVAAARRRLAGETRRQLDGRWCAEEVWGRRYVVSDRGIVDPSPPIERLAAWPVDTETAR